MNLREINWRFALYSSGLLGGVVWAILASVVIGALTTRGERIQIPIGQWLLIGATSLASDLIGATLTLLGRSIRCAAWVLDWWSARSRLGDDRLDQRPGPVGRVN